MEHPDYGATLASIGVCMMHNVDNDACDSGTDCLYLVKCESSSDFENTDTHVHVYTCMKIMEFMLYTLMEIHAWLIVRHFDIEPPHTTISSSCYGNYV